jgi:hypothetical protein
VGGGVFVLLFDLDTIFNVFFLFFLGTAFLNAEF